MTSLDKLREDLDVLFTKHGYTLSSVEEEIDDNIQSIEHIGGRVSGFYCGNRRISLTVTARRFKSLVDNQTRFALVKRGVNSRWTKIKFIEIPINDYFILCEQDGTPVGYYRALSSPYVSDGVWTIEMEEV